MHKRKFYGQAIILPVSILFSIMIASVAIGWTEPTVTPPNNNVSAPINIGSSTQTKTGKLVIGNSDWTQLGLFPSKNDNYNPLTGSSNRAHFHFEFSNVPSGKKALIEIPGDLWLNDSSNLKVDGNMGVGGDINGDGNIEIAGNAIIDGNMNAHAFYYTSDRSLKKDVSIIDGSLEKVTALQGVYFKWISDNSSSMGLIAQDVEKVFPEAVMLNEENGLKSVDYGKLVAPMIEAIKDQQNEISELRAQIKELQERANK